MSKLHVSESVNAGDSFVNINLKYMEFSKTMYLVL